MPKIIVKIEELKHAIEEELGPKAELTKICMNEEGFDSFGWHIQRDLVLRPTALGESVLNNMKILGVTIGTYEREEI
jgi:hypothetical protein